MLILGLAPSSTVLGWGAVEVRENQPRLIKSGILQLRGLPLLRIPSNFSYIWQILKSDEYTDYAMMEYGCTAYSRKGRYASHLEGMMICLAIVKDFPLVFYSLSKVRRSLTKGKYQYCTLDVQLRKTLGVSVTKKHEREQRAIATAVCHARRAKAYDPEEQV